MTTNISVHLQNCKTDVKNSGILNAKPKEYLQSAKEWKFLILASEKHIFF